MSKILTRRWHASLLLLWIVWSVCGSCFDTSCWSADSSCSAAELPHLENAAAKAQASTVTLRVTTSAAGNRAQGRSQGGRSQVGRSQVTVFSGVSLADQLIVTPLFVTENVQVRVTLSGGKQAVARPRVLDEHSGLALLSVDQTIPHAELADEKPMVGSWVLSAAAWGTDLPLVSVGIVGGIDRRMPGTTYPPLLQCNLPQAETSSGAPVLNDRGQLVGIVVASQTSKTNSSWMYAVPVEHVKRLLRVHAGRSDSQPGGEQVVVLKRRRPIVGMDIGGELDHVFVKRVTVDGPAKRAGMQVGDQIVAVDGVQIRSPYQAVTPTIFKQPGDVVQFLVSREDGSKRTFDVVLGGGVALPVAQATGAQLSHLIEPKVVVNSFMLQQTLKNKRSGNVAEVFGNGSGPKPGAGARPATPNASVASSQTSGAATAEGSPQIQLLQEAIERYQSVIDLQRKRLSEQQQDIDQARKRIQDLESEFSDLKELVKKQLPSP